MKSANPNESTLPLTAEVRNASQTGVSKFTPNSETGRMFAMIERMATDPLVDPAKLREILAVKQSWEADESRKLFAAAMADFQSRCPIIEKLDTANGRGYARLDRIHREIRPLLRECGLWFSWTVCEEREGGLIHLEGILGHSSGHQIPCRQLISLPDKISGTNAAQRAGSGQTYAKRYGELAALNVVTGDDSDGNVKPKISGPSTIAPKDLCVKELATRLWNLIKPVVSQDPNWKKTDWVGHNQWLWKYDVLDSAANEIAPDLSAARLTNVIADATRKLKELQ